jgi:hypothetical protein
MTWLEVIAVLLLAFIATIEIYDAIGKADQTVKVNFRLDDKNGHIINEGRRVTCNLCAKNAVHQEYSYYIQFFTRNVELDIESLCEDHAP